MIASHATAPVSNVPTPGQMRELFSQIERGQVTRESLQVFLRGQKGVAYDCTVLGHRIGRDNRCVGCGGRFAQCGQHGSRCSICHQHFADGDDICGGGGHEYGHWYYID